MAGGGEGGRGDAARAYDVLLTPASKKNANPLKTPRHFNAIAGHLVATLKELGVKQQYVDEAIAVVATTKDAVLKQGAFAGRT